MKKLEAAALLGVEETAPQPEIERRYKELYSEFQVRLTNAPTATLKKRYAEQIRELDAAAECLLVGATHEPGRDLPTDEPTYDPQADRRKHERLLTPTMPSEARDQAERRPLQTPLGIREFGRTGPQPILDDPVPAPKPLPSRTPSLAIGGVAVVAIAITLFFLLKPDPDAAETAASDANGGAEPAMVASKSDSLATVSEAMAIAHVELGRAAYTEAAEVLAGARGVMAWLEQTAPADTAVARLRREFQTLRDSIFITCAAERAAGATAGQNVRQCPQP